MSKEMNEGLVFSSHYSKYFQGLNPQICALQPFTETHRICGARSLLGEQTTIVSGSMTTLRVLGNPLPILAPISSGLWSLTTELGL